MKSMNLFGFAKRIILPFVIAIIINIIFSFIFLGGWLNGATLASTPVAILIFGTFLALFPAAYVWLIKSYSFDRGIEYLYKNANPVTSKAIDKVVSSIVLGKQTLDDSPAVVGNALNGAAEFVKNLDDPLPKSFKRILTRLLDRAPIISTLRDIQETTEFTPENLLMIQSEVKASVNNYVENELLGNSNILVWLLALVNIVAIVGAWIYFA
jgi:hypothetical protein